MRRPKIDTLVRATLTIAGAAIVVRKAMAGAPAAHAVRDSATAGHAGGAGAVKRRR